MHIEGIKACICEGAAEGAIIDILGLLSMQRGSMNNLYVQGENPAPFVRKH